MIYSLSGKLVLKEPSLAVIECGGVGYACRTTEKTLQGIGGTGSDVKLLTYLYVREDIIELFGFLTKQELECFKMLMAVSGVGAKTALAILSDMGTEKFMLSVASGDSKAFLKTKGIGAKTAQRIILDLKDKVSLSDIKDAITGDFVAVNENSSAVAETISAMEALGYAQSEVTPIIARLDPSLPSREMIKLTLKQIGKKF